MGSCDNVTVDSARGRPSFAGAGTAPESLPPPAKAREDRASAEGSSPSSPMALAPSNAQASRITRRARNGRGSGSWIYTPRDDPSAHHSKRWAHLAELIARDGHRVTA